MTHRFRAAVVEGISGYDVLINSGPVGFVSKVGDWGYHRYGTNESEGHVFKTRKAATARLLAVASKLRLVPSPKLPVELDDAAIYRMYQVATEIDEKNPSEGRALYEEILSIRPKYTLARVNLGSVYYRLGQPLKAHAQWTRAVTENPLQTEALYNLGYCYLEAGQHEEAEWFLRRSLDTDPDFLDAWYNLGEALERQGRFEEGRRCKDRYERQNEPLLRLVES